MSRIRFFAAIIVALLGGLLTTSAATAEADRTSPYRIAMIVYRGCEDACRGFRDYLAARKIPADVEILDAATDKRRLLDHIARVRRDKPDLLVTWGTTVSLEALGPFDAVDPARHIVDTPAVFMIVSNPVESRLVPNLQSSGRNITGTRYLVPEETQLKAARSYLPFSRLAVIYNPLEENSRLTVANLRRLAAVEDFTLIERQVGLRDGAPDPTSIGPLMAGIRKAGAQLLYQPPDTFLHMQRDTLTAAATAMGIPVLAAAEAPVLDSQALMGVVNRYYTVGQLTAAQAEKILVGKMAPRDIPIEAPRNFSFLVNMRVARELQRYPPMKVLRFAEVVQVGK